ncbi:mannose-1-phosphate guanylyltransferase [Verrucomicrobiota bacterium]
MTNISDNTYAVIMAGGRGERFWPLSTSKHPKQVLSLIGETSLLAMAIDRLKGLIPPERVIVITSADLVDVTCEAAPELPRKNVIGEPFGRDTAAAVALGSAIVKARVNNGAFCILTADHIIRDLDIFHATLREGFNIALSEDVLITIGIKPTFPSTGFGYIESGESFEHQGQIKFLKARKFVEKPDIETAKKYLESGNYCWNSGMFIWSVSSIQNALGQHQPQLLEMADNMESVVDKPEFRSCLEKEYGKLEKISVDYAIMEKADNILMAEGVFRWDDVGSWNALENHFDADSSSNVLTGNCEVLDSDNNIVVSKERLTTLIGVKDLVVVQAENATLICAKDKAQEVKKMVKHLQNKGQYENVL